MLSRLSLAESPKSTNKQNVHCVVRNMKSISCFEILFKYVKVNNHVVFTDKIFRNMGHNKIANAK